MAENTVEMSQGSGPKKGSLIKDAFALFVITLIAAIALGFVYEITKDIIAEREREEKEAAYRSVFPQAARLEEDEALTTAIAEADALLAEAGFSGCAVNEGMAAKDESGNTIGYVVNVSSMNGYGGEIALSMGYTNDGILLGIQFTTLDETAGLGARAAEEGEGSFKEQFREKQVDSFTVKKGDASSENEINAISAATVTSTAVTEAVNAGIYFVKQIME